MLDEVCPLSLLTSARSRCSKTAFLLLAALLPISLWLFQDLLHKCSSSMNGINVSWKLVSTGLQDVACELKRVLTSLTLLVIFGMYIPVSKAISWHREFWWNNLHVMACWCCSVTCLMVSVALQVCQDIFWSLYVLHKVRMQCGCACPRKVKLFAWLWLSYRSSCSAFANSPCHKPLMIEQLSPPIKGTVASK